MNESRRAQAFYLPEPDRDGSIAPPSEPRAPRPGHGTVYVCLGMDTRRNPVWEATWDDDPGDGDPPGSHHVDGDRATVLAWARSRPAAARLIATPASPQWRPLPERDEDVDVG
ncbi:hypothetical protein [Polymorphospora sp. NPDC050346]|uniref:hypothetical protein n=1 Tax=Polymorphospora sp. NPDC050346 TaxID=3155780 RepID=UPI0033E929A4